MELEKMDGKHRALLALTVAAEAFFVATNEALEAKFPGRSAQNRALLDEGRAHLCVSVQCGSGQVRAAIGLVQPEFVKTLEAPEMELNGPLSAIFGDPEKARMIDLGKLN